MSECPDVSPQNGQPKRETQTGNKNAFAFRPSMAGVMHMRHCTENVTDVLSCCFCLRVFAWCAVACQGRSLPCLCFVFPTHPWRHCTWRHCPSPHGLDSGAAFSPGGALRSILPFITTTIVTTRAARWNKHRPAGNKREPPFLPQGQVVPRLLAGGANRSGA